MMKAHELKCWPSSYSVLKRGTKTAEFRRNDRDFRVGDVLLLHEYVPGSGDCPDEERRARETAGQGRFGYTGNTQLFTITDVLDDPAYGIPDGFAMLSLARLYKCEARD